MSGRDAISCVRVDLLTKKKRSSRERGRKSGFVRGDIQRKRGEDMPEQTRHGRPYWSGQGIVEHPKKIVCR